MIISAVRWMAKRWKTYDFFTDSLKYKNWGLDSKKMKETSREKQVLRKQGDDFNQISDNRIYNCYMLNTFAVFSYLCCYQRNKVKGRKYI